MAKPQRVHEVTIKVTFNKPVSRREAVDAVWNDIEGTRLYGDSSYGDSWDTGKIKVRRR